MARSIVNIKGVIETAFRMWAVDSANTASMNRYSIPRKSAFLWVDHTANVLVLLRGENNFCQEQAFVAYTDTNEFYLCNIGRTTGKPVSVDTRIADRTTGLCRVATAEEALRELLSLVSGPKLERTA